MTDLIVSVILVLIVGGAAFYIIRAKKNGAKCIGCPAGGSCTGSRPQKKRLDGPVVCKKTLTIDGMHCEHCAMSVTQRLNRIDGVSAQVKLSKGRATVSCDRQVDNSTLKSAVEQAGYRVIDIT